MDAKENLPDSGPGDQTSSGGLDLGEIRRTFAREKLREIHLGVRDPDAGERPPLIEAGGVDPEDWRRSTLRRVVDLLAGLDPEDPSDDLEELASRHRRPIRPARARELVARGHDVSGIDARLVALEAAVREAVELWWRATGRHLDSYGRPTAPADPAVFAPGAPPVEHRWDNALTEVGTELVVGTRSRRRRPDPVDPAELAALAAAGEHALGADLADPNRALLAEELALHPVLTDAQREVLLLDLEGRETAEIARRLGISSGAVYERRAAAHRRLRRAVGGG